MNTITKPPLGITNKYDLTSLLNRSMPSKYSIATIPNGFHDTAKTAVLKSISAEIISRGKKSDVAVLVLEAPQAK